MRGLIEAAATAGADAVKFQMFSPREVKDSRWRDALESMVLHSADLYHYASMAKELGLDVVVTPMYPEAVEELRAIDEVIDGIKVRATDWANAAIVDPAIATRKPVYISVPHNVDTVVKPEGMTHQQFMSAFLKTHSAKVSRVYCVPRYPTALEDLAMLTAVTCDGYSNHFPAWTVPYTAACNRIMWENIHNTKSRYYLEVHIMPDGANPADTIDHAVSITAADLKALVQAVKLAEAMS
jgi:sialic acid synthase SpsE